jgi:hypothetical protein
LAHFNFFTIMLSQPFINQQLKKLQDILIAFQ